MGILSDFIVATREDALAYGKLFLGTPPSPERLLRAEYKSFTPLVLEMLWAMLRGEEWGVKRHKLEHVWQAGNGEEWLFRFPDELVNLLAALDDATMESIAGIWARSEEVRSSAEELTPRPTRFEGAWYSGSEAWSRRIPMGIALRLLAGSISLCASVRANWRSPGDKLMTCYVM